MICIAIDGPSGTGKSTISKLLAKRLNFKSVDTGSLYRAIAYYFKINKIDFENYDIDLDKILSKIKLDIKFENDNFNIYLNDEKLPSEIYTDEMSVMASKISIFKKVRDFLFKFQKKLANENNVIMNGRDIGTVIVPEAQVKIYLTASLEVIAMRRYYQLQKTTSYNQILENLKIRNYNDKNRRYAPLTKTSDYIVVDSSELNLEETLDKIYNIVKENLNLNNEY